MKTTPWISFVSLTMLIACLIPVDDLIAEKPTTSTSIRQSAGKAEADQAAKTIQWSVLAPENGKPFNDPFAKLTQNQLSDLSYVVRVQRLIAEEKITADGVDAKEAERLAGKLTTEGVDIGWLMVQRARVQQIRGLQVDNLSTSIAESFGNKKVTLTGYVIPIKASQERLTEFFLVPTSVTCSREAAPSPLHVLFISTDQGIVRPDTKVPVRVTGTVQAKSSKRAVRNGIAVTTVQSAYTMLYPQIEVYAPPGK